MVSTNILLLICGTTTAMSLLRRDASPPASALGIYPVARTACITFSTVFGLTNCGVFSARLTVIEDSPAARATSSSVGARGVSGRFNVVSPASANYDEYALFMMFPAITRRPHRYLSKNNRLEININHAMLAISFRIVQLPKADWNVT